ncbi:hypothetical protein JCM9279_002540 [Rhodotorula babjevae]
MSLPLMLARRSLVTRAAPTFARSLSTSTVLSSPTPTPRRKVDEKGYEHHFKDSVAVAPEPAPAAVQPTTAAPWQPSRPHEKYLLAYPVYSPAELDAVKVTSFEPKTMADKWARFLVKKARWAFDLVSGYKHADSDAARAAAKKDGKGDDLSLQQLRDQGYLMRRDDWMLRILFLESVAGVPGFTAAMLRHLRSLRLMRRDGGWINGLLQEAENERMVRRHLLTFLKIRGPSPLFRLMVLAAQGVFTNAFFLSYLVSPKSCHRFVGYLEEEAVHTYTGLVKALERNEVPEWAPETGFRVPQISIDYWRLPQDATMLDLVRAVRADEAGHRFVNHTLANLGQDDPNPTSFKHASATIQGTQAGFSREESMAWAKQVEEEMTVAKKAGEEEMRKLEKSE